ncbi:hypothetical protein Tco_0612217 [Tanacetum coccineum]
MSHPHPKGNFVPKAFLMKFGLKTLTTARQNFSKAAVSVNTARPINTAFPRPTVNCVRPTSNVFNRTRSHVKSPFNKFTTEKNSNFNEKVNTVKGNVTTVGPKAVVSVNKGNEANAVKASACWVRRPKQKVLDHGNPQQELKDKEVIDSGYSRHMTGNRSYLTDYEEIDGGFIAFGGSTKRGKITGKGKIRTGKLDIKDVYFVKELKFNLFSVSQMCDKKNNVLFTDTECVVLSPDFNLTDESHDTLPIADLDADAKVTLIDETQVRNDEDLMFDIGVLYGDEVFEEPIVNTAPTISSILVSDVDSVTIADEVVTSCLRVESYNFSAAPTTAIDELTMGQTLIEIKAAKPKAVTTAATTTTTRPEARGVVVQEPSEFTTTTSPSQASQLP